MTDVTELHGEGEFDKRQWEFLLATYEDRQRMIGASEELGERRLQMYLTVVAAAGVAVGLVSDSANQRATLAAGSAACVLLVVLGLSTTMRIAKRDCATGWLKNDLLKLRRYVAEGTPLANILPHMDDVEPWKRPRAWHPTRGGLVDLLGVLTSTFAGLSVFAAWTAVGEINGAALWPPLIAGLVVACAMWLLTVKMVRGVYSANGCLAGQTGAATFRANVGLVVRRDDGMVLMCRRVKEQTWQFPQGGLHQGEESEAAAKRELAEETSLRIPDDATIVRSLDRWLTYELPIGSRTSKTGLGQVQKWFLLELVRADQTIHLPTDKDREFDDYRWVSPAEAVDLVIDFRKPNYAVVTSAFFSIS